MPYSIPDDEEVLDALRSVMRRMKGINSLTKLRTLILKELKNRDPSYTISRERLRKMAARAPFLKVSIDARQKDKVKSLRGKCPVCGGKLKTTKNETIFGGTVTLGYRCTQCPYWTSLKRRVPTRYHFEFDQEK
ncbi:MAG: hypothetical protein R6U17_01295 [Thermoplasmata archaeon]